MTTKKKQTTPPTSQRKSRCVNGNREFDGKHDGKQFSKDYQPTFEGLSRGQRIRRIREELMERMCLAITGGEKIEDAIKSAFEKAIAGEPADFIKLIALAKPADKQEVEVNDVTDRFALFARKAEEWKKKHGDTE